MYLQLSRTRGIAHVGFIAQPSKILESWERSCLSGAQSSGEIRARDVQFGESALALIPRAQYWASPGCIRETAPKCQGLRLPDTAASHCARPYRGNFQNTSSARIHPRCWSYVNLTKTLPRFRERGLKLAESRVEKKKEATTLISCEFYFTSVL